MIYYPSRISILPKLLHCLLIFRKTQKPTCRNMKLYHIDACRPYPLRYNLTFLMSRQCCSCCKMSCGKTPPKTWYLWIKNAYYLFKMFIFKNILMIKVLWHFLKMCFQKHMKSFLSAFLRTWHMCFLSFFSSWTDFLFTQLSRKDGWVVS